MFAALAAAMLAQQASAPQGPAPSTPAQPAKSASEQTAQACQTPPPDPKTQEIVVCAIKPDGYRLNPDVMEAKRELKSGGRPVRPGQLPYGNECSTVGPMGCRGVPTINLLAVAATAAEISQRLAKGQEIGSIFVTDPHPSEYQLYLEAKKEREAKEAEKAEARAAKSSEASAQTARAASPTDSAAASKPAE